MQRTQRKTNLDTLIQQGVIERDSKSWLIEALDPFHDSPIEVSGMPDTNLASSVIQCVKYQQTLRQPASIGNTNNWDCNIVMWPLPVQQAVSSSNVCINTGAGGTVFGPTAFKYGSSGINNFPIGGVTSYSVLTGNQTYGDTAGTTSTTDLTLGLEASYLEGNARVVGMGFEVANSTAELYLQGEVTVYRQPVPSPDTMTSVIMFNTNATEDGEDGAPTRERRRSKSKGTTEYSSWSEEDPSLAATYIADMGWVTTWQTSVPPQTLAQATKLTGSKTWPAKYGNYNVATMNTTLNPAKAPVPCQALIHNGPVPTTGQASTAISSGFMGITTTDAFGPVKSGAAGSVQPIGGSPQHVAPFNVTGAYYTGLSPQTSLTVSVIYYVERFPTPFENDLVVLARPSSPFDPRALEIYGLTMNKLPVGVMQNENPLGEWFSDVLDEVASVASPIGHALSMVPGIGAPAALAGNVADMYLNTRKQTQRKKQKIKNPKTKQKSPKAQKADAAPANRPKKPKVAGGNS